MVFALAGPARGAAGGFCGARICPEISVELVVLDAGARASLALDEPSGETTTDAPGGKSGVGVALALASMRLVAVEAEAGLNPDAFPFFARKNKYDAATTHRTMRAPPTNKTFA